MVIACTIGMSSPSKNVSPSRQITVVDVYDLAAAIGKDFEGLIDQFGAECVRALMPKVISSLETLEALANTNERENEEIVSLKKAVERFELDKAHSKEERVRFEQELELREDVLRKEIKDVWEMVQKLQNENQRLNENLAEHDCSCHVQTSLADEDLAMMLKLKVTVDQLRDQIKNLQRDGEDRAQEIETHQLHCDKLIRQNKELQRKYKAVQNHSRVIVEEKSELISQLQQKEEALIRIEHRLGETERAKKDLEQTKVEETQGMDRENMPRFTLAELREVLQEKNRLKARVLELEEEMEMLRPNMAPSPVPSISEKADDELLVYGPLPREPDEKLYPWRYQRKDSGVRKFSFSFRWMKSSKSTPRNMMRMSDVGDDLSTTTDSACSFPSDSCSRTAELILPFPLVTTSQSPLLDPFEINIQDSHHQSTFDPNFDHCHINSLDSPTGTVIGIEIPES